MNFQLQKIYRNNEDYEQFFNNLLEVNNGIQKSDQKTSEIEIGDIRRERERENIFEPDLSEKF